ncbi:putative cobalt transporter subunit family protein [Rhodococcus sp. MTM3W5.2]|uniref:CbtA family protein n=1 Tax=Rhodococcus sp. MTM3W5.2 TaxID=1805827 RepID=UPI0009792DEC|nr:CbtA family protein [Rhodococcus sp. MTM3W5.2]AQA23553.1 putative cobalt transporter subunit family protein [Rhodococcus sp. MTM3W5.2]
MPLTGTFKNLLIRGLLAGLIAGLLAGAVAFVIGEPHIDAAIAIEEAAAAPVEPHGHDAGTTEATTGAESGGHSHGDSEEPLVSRDGQRFGLFLATSLAGLALGALFAAVAYYARRVSGLSGPILALTLAGLGWLAVEAVPFFKYPANPPAVGDPETINNRTWLWLAAVVLGLAAVSIAAYVAKVVAANQFLTVRIAAPLLAFLAVAGIGYLVLPDINEVGPDFPASLLWDFRVSSLTIQATLWLALGLGFAFLTERAAKASSQSESLTAR